MTDELHASIVEDLPEINEDADPRGLAVLARSSFTRIRDMPGKGNPKIVVKRSDQSVHLRGVGTVEPS